MKNDERIGPSEIGREALAREIKKYNITSITHVRGRGSRFDEHPLRCLWEICGKPMLQWALEAPLSSKYVNKVVLSSEDRKIMKFGEEIKGVTLVPRALDEVLQIPRDWNSGVFQRQRPRSLLSGVSFNPGPLSAREKNTWRAAHCYCLWYLQEYESFVTDIEMITPANEPMATTETFDRLIEAFFLDEEADTAYTFYPILPCIFTINPKTKRPFPVLYDHGLDRQCYPPVYRRGPPLLFGNPLKSTYGCNFKIAYILIPHEEGLDIHNEEDLALANFYMRRRLDRKGE